MALFQAVLLHAVALAAAKSEGCVVVTGATGWVAGHTISALLAHGRSVHGTVRDPANAEKVAFLWALETKHAAKGGKLALFKADIYDDGAYDEAVVGCTAFVHPAFGFGGDMVSLALKSTTIALAAATEAKTIVSFVLTSSVAAALNYDTGRGLTPLTAHVDGRDALTESDWAGDKPFFGDYGAAKQAQEKLVARWVADAAAKSESGVAPFRASAVLFYNAYGPQLGERVTSSNMFPQMPLLGTLPFAPPVTIHAVDIRDVGAAHALLASHPAASGRYIVAPPSEGTPGGRPGQRTCWSVVDMARLYRDDAALSKMYTRLPFIHFPIALFRFFFALMPRSVHTDPGQMVGVGPGSCRPGGDGTRLVSAHSFLSFLLLHSMLRSFFFLHLYLFIIPYMH